MIALNDRSQVVMENGGETTRRKTQHNTSYNGRCQAGMHGSDHGEGAFLAGIADAIAQGFWIFSNTDMTTASGYSNTERRKPER